MNMKKIKDMNKRMDRLTLLGKNYLEESYILTKMKDREQTIKECLVPSIQDMEEHLKKTHHDKLENLSQEIITIMGSQGGEEFMKKLSHLCDILWSIEELDEDDPERITRVAQEFNIEYEKEYLILLLKSNSMLREELEECYSVEDQLLKLSFNEVLFQVISPKESIKQVKTLRKHIDGFFKKYYREWKKLQEPEVVVYLKDYN